MKDLAKFTRNQFKAKRTIVVAVLMLCFSVAGLPTSSSEADGAVSQNGRRPPYAKLATPNPTLGRKPLKSFVCLSSWYGGQFDGQLTANGEIYDMYGQTAAHPSLPLGSVVRVVNLRTRRSAIVRINDRGPYIPGRDLDVSYQVARELGFARRGTARVRVDLLKVPPSATVHPGN